MSENINNYIKEIDETCKEYKVLLDDNKIALAKILERKLISNIDNIIREYTIDDELFIPKIINKLYVEAIDSKEILFKSSELAKKAIEINGNEEFYIDSLVKSIKFLNFNMLSHIINSSYFKENYIFIINEMKNYLINENKYSLMYQLAYEISELRNITYKQILSHYILEMNKVIDEMDISKKKKYSIHIFKYNKIRFELIKKYKLTKLFSEFTKEKPKNTISIYIYLALSMFIFILLILFYFFGNEIIQFIINYSG